MKQAICSVFMLGSMMLLVSCTLGSGGGGVYRHYHGHSPWYGPYGYYPDGGVIVVPDDPIEEAGPLPSGEELMPDFGMPMGMDF